MELVDWTFLNWEICKEELSRNKIFDLCSNPSKVESDAASSKNQTGGAMIPLHDIGAKMDALATVIMFSRTTENGCTLTPCSKVQFFSDANQINLVAELSASSGAAMTTLPPMMLNYGKVWAKYLPGSIALLDLD